MKDKTIDEADCMEVSVGQMVTLNENQRATQSVCINLVGSQKRAMILRLQTTNSVPSFDMPLGGDLSAAELEKLSKMITARKKPFSTDDDNECEDGQCLEVQAVIDVNDGLEYWSDVASGYLVFYIRQIQGGDNVFIKSADSRLKLRSASVTTAIEDAGTDKMEEFGKNEQQVLLRDVPKSELFDWGWDPDCLPINISQWLADEFGGSSQKFNMTCKYSGDAPIDCRVDHQWGVKLDQDICITKVDADKVADHVSQKSKADLVSADNLFDFQSASFVSQIGRNVVQNQWISHSIILGIGCVLPTIFKAIIQKMAPRRVRRRTRRPQIGILEHNGILDMRVMH